MESTWPLAVWLRGTLCVPSHHITTLIQGRCQLHCDCLPFVPQHRPQPQLPPPPRGATDAINISSCRQLKPQKEQGTSQSDALLFVCSLFVCSFVCCFGRVLQMVEMWTDYDRCKPDDNFSCAGQTRQSDSRVLPATSKHLCQTQVVPKYVLNNHWKQRESPPRFPTICGTGTTQLDTSIDDFLHTVRPETFSESIPAAQKIEFESCK